jgi:hypothetical protein
MNEKQQEIYNQYLKAIAKVNNRPYKLRKDFSNLDEDSKIILYRLELFFDKFSHIQPYNFFLAFLEYKELKYASLDSYLKQSAIIAYSRYSKQKYDEYVDSEKSLEDFMQGIRNIVAFCLENSIPTKNYRTAVNNNGVPWILIHLNEQKISYYHLHALDISRTNIKSDYTDIVFRDFDEMFSSTKQKYVNSNKLKQLGNKIREKIERN